MVSFGPTIAITHVSRRTHVVCLVEDEKPPFHQLIIRLRLVGHRLTPPAAAGRVGTLTAPAPAIRSARSDPSTAAIMGYLLCATPL
jgi:hypothetical protein